VSRVPFWFAFHEDSIGGSKGDAPLGPGHVRGEEVVADQVESLAQSAGQLLPTLPVLVVWPRPIAVPPGSPPSPVQPVGLT
jgi:hypothetical protein